MWKNRAVQNNINIKKLVSLFYPLNLESWHAELKEKESYGYRFDCRKFKCFSQKKLNGINAMLQRDHLEKIDPIRFIGNFSSDYKDMKLQKLYLFGQKLF